jgi:hypothetical protein
MKAKIGISIFFLSVFVLGVYAAEQTPAAISPGK